MAGYDITSVLDFQPPRFLCMRCRGILVSPIGLHLDHPTKTATCPVCHAVYETEPSEIDDWWAGLPARWLKIHGHEVQFDDVMEHSRSLAWMVLDSRGDDRFGREPWPMMRLLFTALSRAQSFVHFASYGISHQLLGALKMASMKVDVCGWASNVDSNTRAEMEEWPTEAPRFKAKAINSNSWVQAVPHQKLVIVDGLIAFKGSANLTNHGLRQVDRAFDTGELVTDVDEVRELNNTYFANVWAKIGEYPEPNVLMSGLSGVGRGYY